MATKRKYSIMAIEKKVEILQMLKSGKSQNFIAKEYSISPSSVRIISERERDITKYFQTSTANRSTKYLTRIQRSDLESVLYQWCVLCRKRHIETSATLIRKKALELREKLHLDPRFSASHKWVASFMERYGINAANVKIFRSRNRTSADIFRISFGRYLKDSRCTLENIYNVSYTGLMWKAVPEYTWIFRNEKSMVCPNMYKDHVTVLLCANATGCHKLPVLVIARSANSDHDSNEININALSIMYEKSSQAFVDNKIFNKWFARCFLRSIIEKQTRKARKEKVLLMVDNARWDYDFGLSRKRDDISTVVCFPYHATPHIQPMDCGIIECFKIMYRKELLEALLPLPNCNTKDNVLINHKDLILWDCCRMIRNAWSDVENTILKISWSKLLVNESSERFAYKSIMERNIQQIYALLAVLSGCHPFRNSDLENWFKIDQIEKILMKVCTDEVLQRFQDTILKQRNAATVNNEHELSRY